MPFVIWGLAPGFDAEKLSMTVYVSRIMFGYVILVCAVGFLSAILNAFSEFIYAAITPIFFNIFLIMGLVIFRVNLPALAVVVLITGFVQIYILWARLQRRNFGLRLIWPRMTPLMKSMGKRMSWGFVGSGFYQLNVIVGVLIASYQTGAVSYLYYADRLVQLPFAIVGLAAGTVILTKVSDAISSKKMNAVYMYQNAAMRQSMMLILPCVAGLFVLAEPIIRTLFQYGEWTPEATKAVAGVIMILVWGLPLMTTSQLYMKTIYASGDAKTPVKISAASLALAVSLMLLLMGELGYLAVPVGTVIGGFARNVWLKRVCKRRELYKADRNTVLALSVFFAMSVLMGAGLYKVLPLVTGVVPLALTIALAAIIYLPLALFCDKIILRK